MQKHILISVLALAALPRLAHAEDDDANWRERGFAGTGLGWYGMYIADMREYGTHSGDATDNDPSRCQGVIDEYKGVIGGKEKIASTWFKIVPGAVEKPNSGSPLQWEIPFSKATWLCETYAEMRTMVLAAAPLEDYYEKLGVYKIVEDSYEARDWYLIATGVQKVEDGKYQVFADECSAAIDTAITAGAKPDVAIMFGRTEALTLEELRGRCQASVETGRAAAEKLREWAKAKYDEVAAPLKKAGIKGDRLDLFIYYPGEWLLPGCTTSTADPKKLKKAKKLFQWLTDPYGTEDITVRTYTFKGDKYKVKEQQYALEEKAYKGCK